MGATPRRQQVGELIGVLTCAVFVCWTVQLMSPDFGSEKLPAPQATLMRVVIDGVLQQSLPWGMIAIGAGIAVMVELCRLPSLPFAVGVYLPVTTMVPVFAGGLLRWFLARRAGSPDEAAGRRERGVLFGSGLVGGEGLMGVGVAGAAFYSGQSPEGFGTGWASRIVQYLGGPEGLTEAAPSIAALLGFVLLILIYARCCRDRPTRSPHSPGDA